MPFYLIWRKALVEIESIVISHQFAECRTHEYKTETLTSWSTNLNQIQINTLKHWNICQKHSPYEWLTNSFADKIDTTYSETRAFRKRYSTKRLNVHHWRHAQVRQRGTARIQQPFRWKHWIPVPQSSDVLAAKCAASGTSVRWWADLPLLWDWGGTKSIGHTNHVKRVLWMLTANRVLGCRCMRVRVHFEVHVHSPVCVCVCVHR